jgi:uncharacterized protein
LIDQAGRLLSQASHRPWRLPGGPWMMFQSWQNLLFAHWRVEPSAIRPLIPPQLELDLREDAAWIALTPFLLTGLRLRLLPPVPGTSEFPELNLRTYVRCAGRPGIYFFSLDAASRLAVTGARTLFRLPYRHATMALEAESGWTRFRSQRAGATATFTARYRPAGPVTLPEPGSLEAFLTERYALFTVLRNGKVLRGDIHHRPWPLQTAEGVVDGAELAAAEGVPLPADAPLLHFSERQDTLIWPPVPAERR